MSKIKIKPADAQTLARLISQNEIKNIRTWRDEGGKTWKGIQDRQISISLQT